MHLVAQMHSAVHQSLHLHQRQHFHRNDMQQMQLVPQPQHLPQVLYEHLLNLHLHQKLCHLIPLILLAMLQLQLRTHQAEVVAKQQCLLHSLEEECLAFLMILLVFPLALQSLLLNLNLAQLQLL
jgi:hypothetical protein